MPGMLKAFGDALGRREACAAALLHEDEECRELARARWAEWAGTSPEAEAVDNATALLRALCGTVVEALEARKTATDVTDLTNPEPPPKPETTPEPSPELTRKLNEAERELKRARREAQESKAQTERLSKQVGTLKSANKALEVDLRDTRKTLRESEERQEARIQIAAQRLADERLMPWLTDCETLASVKASVDGDNLLARVEFTLERQAKRDRRYGIRSQITQRIADCRIALAKVEAASHDALRPLPDLVTLEQALRHEITALTDQLARARGLSETDSQIHERISRAQTQQDLAAVRGTIVAGLSSKKLQIEDRAEVFTHLLQASLLRAMEARFAAEKEDIAADMACNPIVDFWQRLQMGEPLTMLVDGHNVLARPGIARTGSESWHSAPARDALTARLREFASDYPQLHVDLWFDSPTSYDENVSANLRVKFSGGTGANRADAAILRQIENHPASVTLYLVTADWDEAQKAQALGAKVFLPEELEGLLG
jgi:predicted RNA-binding protein with PIN domain